MSAGSDGDEQESMTMASKSASSLTDDLRSGLAQVLEAVAARVRGQTALEDKPEAKAELEREMQDLRVRVEALERGRSHAEPTSPSSDALSDA